jgi:hypothetical protein
MRCVYQTRTIVHQMYNSIVNNAIMPKHCGTRYIRGTQCRMPRPIQHAQNRVPVEIPVICHTAAVDLRGKRGDRKRTDVRDGFRKQETRRGSLFQHEAW